MAKAKTSFFCQECGFESSKWMGQCPGCHAWNSFVEELPISLGRKRSSGDRNADIDPVRLSEIESGFEERLSTEIKELDRVLGGGIVKGSLVLVGGDPGIGKSTLLLQMCRSLSSKNIKLLYVSGEESLRQIRMRAERLGSFDKDIFLLCETNLGDIQEAVRKYKPDILIIDSIQTMYLDDVNSGPGSVTQVREVTSALMHLAKREDISVFIVGHVTKEGVVAGPRVLEHMVDTVLYFEGDRHASYRILRAVKNRFGSTNEIGVFEMKSDGLAQVMDPSGYLLGGRAEDAAGSVVSCALEGSRPIMIEVQALVCKTNFQIPRRTATGVDFNRVNLIIAVLEKRLGLKMAACDAYINIAGGMKLSEPAIDLALAAAIISSFTDKALSSDLLFFGEIGLTGEVRAVSQAESRIREAAKLGFKKCCIPAANLRHLSEGKSGPDGKGAKSQNLFGMEVTGIGSVGELYSYLKDK